MDNTNVSSTIKTSEAPVMDQLNLAEIIETSQPEFAKYVKHQRIAGRTKRELWEGGLGHLARGLRTWYSRKSRSIFNEACLTLINKGEAAFAQELSVLNTIYQDFIPRQRAVFAALEVEWAESSFMVLSHQIGGVESFDYQYVDYSKAELLEFIRSDAFNPKEFARWAERSFNLKEIREDLCRTRLGAQAWERVKEGMFTKAKRQELMEADESKNTVAVYYLCQALVRQAFNDLAFWKPVYEWKIDSLERQLKEVWAGSHDSEAEIRSSGDEDKESLNQLRADWASMEEEFAYTVGVLNEAVGEFHKVFNDRDSFPLAFKEVAPGQYKPVFNQNEAFGVVAARNLDREMANKDKQDAVVLDAIEAALNSEVQL